MRQKDNNTDSRRGKHLTRADRIRIETLFNKKYKPTEIAEYLERDRRTIEREIERGKVVHVDSNLVEKIAYSSDRGQIVHDLNATAKGPQLKLGANYEMVDFISVQILVHSKSPDVIAAMMKKMDMPGRVCTKTIYNLIDQELIKDVTNKNLLEKSNRTKQKKRNVKRAKLKKHTRRTSIDERPPEVETRIEFGHWEMDLILGGKSTSKPVLLTLIERKTRKTIIKKLPDKTQKSVLKALKSIEGGMGASAFRSIFKSITTDNGSEFLDVEGLERSAFSKKMRVKLYYAHPYSAWEKGSIENVNRMIRRFIAKGYDIGKITTSFLRYVENWINDYPRKILDYNAARDCYKREIAA